MNQRIFVQYRDGRICNLNDRHRVVSVLVDCVFHLSTHNCYTVVVDICPLVEFLLDFGGFVERSGPGMGIRSRAPQGKDLKLYLHHAPGVKGGPVDVWHHSE